MGEVPKRNSRGQLIVKFAAWLDMYRFAEACGIDHYAAFLFLKKHFKAVFERVEFKDAPDSSNRWRMAVPQAEGAAAIKKFREERKAKQEKEEARRRGDEEHRRTLPQRERRIAEARQIIADARRELSGISRDTQNEISKRRVHLSNNLNKEKRIIQDATDKAVASLEADAKTSWDQLMEFLEIQKDEALLKGAEEHEAAIARFKEAAIALPDQVHAEQTVRIATLNRNIANAQVVIDNKGRSA